MLIYLQMLDTPEERAKFETLYYAHRRTMLHIAMQILKDHQLAEDAVQEAFLRLVKNFSKIGQVNCPRTRLFTVIIVRNISLTMLTSSFNPFMNRLMDSLDALINNNREWAAEKPWMSGMIRTDYIDRESVYNSFQNVISKA